MTDLVRGASIADAHAQLKFSTKRAARPILKLLNSAIANAENNLQLDKNNLYVKEIKVDSGPILKRMMPRARGQADLIQKRTSHITLILDEIKPTTEKKVAQKKKQAKPEVVSAEKVQETEKELGQKKDTKKEARKGWQADSVKGKTKKEGQKGEKMFRRKSI